MYHSDTALLEGLSKGESAAMRELYSRYHSSVIKWIVGRGGMDVDAEDAFQEAIVVVYEKSKDINFRLSASIGTYLFAVCKNLWMKKVNTKAVTDTFYFDEVVPEMEQLDEDNDIQLLKEKEASFEIMYTAMDQLGNPCSDLLKAFYMEGKSMQEIAVLFSYSNAENAKTQKYKCLTRLKKIFFGKQDEGSK